MKLECEATLSYPSGDGGEADFDQNECNEQIAKLQSLLVRILKDFGESFACKSTVRDHYRPEECECNGCRLYLEAAEMVGLRVTS